MTGFFLFGTLQLDVARLWMNRGTLESLMIIRIREGTRIRVAADRDCGKDVVWFLDRTKMLESLPSDLQVYQLLGPNAKIDRYHDRFDCNCRTLHD